MLHHVNLKVGHHDLTVGVHLFGEVVLGLRGPSCAQAILGARTNHYKSRIKNVLALISAFNSGND